MTKRIETKIRSAPCRYPVICSFFAFRLNEGQIPNKFKSKLIRKTSIVNFCISRNPKHKNSSVHMRSVRHLKTKQKRLHSQCESFQLLDEMESFVESIVRSNVMRMNSKRILLSVLLTAPHQINQFSVLISQFAFHMKFVKWSFSYIFMQNEIAISHVPGVFQSECMIVDGPERKSRRENHFVLFRCAYIQSGSPRIVSHLCLSIVSCPSPCPPNDRQFVSMSTLSAVIQIMPSFSLYISVVAPFVATIRSVFAFIFC